MRTVLGLSVLLLAAVPALSQEAVLRPTHTVVISGYGTAGAMKAQARPSSFFAQVAPIFLVQFTDRVLFESELEFELEEGATRTGLEYASISLLANDYLTVTAGKFLVPFGVFGQRLHPTWINRFTSMPPLFGHEGGIAGSVPLLPVLSDIGVMGSAVLPLRGPGRSITFSAFATNGPMPEDETHGAQQMAGEHGGPDLGFGESVEDNNGDKMIGGRLGLVLAPQLEINLSALRAEWGHATTRPNVDRGLRFWGFNAAADIRVGPLELRSEWVRLAVDEEEIDTLAMTSEIESVNKWGGYVQAAYRVAAWEPVVRFSLVDPSDHDPRDRLTQYGFGLNYYLTPSISVMAAFELNRDRFDAGSDLENNRFLVHWAFGF